jgi:hypothetical protein
MYKAVMGHSKSTVYAYIGEKRDPVLPGNLIPIPPEYKSYNLWDLKEKVTKDGKILAKSCGMKFKKIWV